MEDPVTDADRLAELTQRIEHLAGRLDVVEKILADARARFDEVAKGPMGKMLAGMGLRL